MLNSTTIKKIEDFVYTKPRSIQEIAQYIGKNWRTADRYIEEIGKNFGTISTRTFRGGTRGALKIVYWAAIEKISNSIFQEILEKEIMGAKGKEDFSAFDIFQHVNNKNKNAVIKRGVDESVGIEEITGLLKNAQKQVLIFSGNLSFINLKDKKDKILKTIESLVGGGVTIKIICRVDIIGKENIENILSLNFKYGDEKIEVRHREQPLRAFLIDNKIFRIKEIKEPTGKINELNKKLFIFYTIRDKEWAEWLSKIFWKMFSSSIKADKRLEEIKKLRVEK